MPKFKKNPNPIRQNFGVGVTENPDATSPNSSGFKMKYKHSAFPFKNSPAKQEVEEVPQHTHEGEGMEDPTESTRLSNFGRRWDTTRRNIEPGWGGRNVGPGTMMSNL